LEKLQIAVPNFVGLGQPRSSKTWQARIEYPLNSVATANALTPVNSVPTADSMTTVTWNGLPQVSIPVNQPYALSDVVQLKEPIPDNALFWVRLWQQDTSASALVCQNIGNFSWDPQHPLSPTPLPARTNNQALGETNCPGDFTLLDHPVFQDPSNGNAYFTDGGGGIYRGTSPWVTVRPLAILGQSRKPAFSLWGDSRVCGIGDSFDSVCDDRGEAERSIGPAFAYINFASPGLPAASLSSLFRNVLPDYVPHLVFGKYTTNLIEDLGGPDCIYYADPDTKQHADASTAIDNIMVDKNIIWSHWIGLGNNPPSMSTLTLPPYTGNPAANVYLKAFSDSLRTGYNFQFPVRVLDIASIVAMVDGSNQYAWRCPEYNVDGLHESRAGCRAIQESGIMDPYALTH
jgi:hypothetical protein